jgi:hypothetical protein
MTRMSQFIRDGETLLNQGAYYKFYTRNFISVDTDINLSITTLNNSISSLMISSKYHTLIRLSVQRPPDQSPGRL